MPWDVLVFPEFDEEIMSLDIEVQRKLFAKARLLADFGPQLARPHVDTLYDSQHNNMKELRFSVRGGVWRVAFAFDPKRQAVLLVAGDKNGQNQQKFYRKFIREADARFTVWLDAMQGGENES